jgi:hypothetical protein
MQTQTAPYFESTKRAPRQWGRYAVKLIAALAIALLIVWGETWMITNAPASIAACNFARSTDVTHVVHNDFSADPGPVSVQ